MTFIDNIRQLTSDADKVKDNFLVSIRKQIEVAAKNGGHYTGFYADGLCHIATEALGRHYFDSPVFDTKGHPASVKETFELFEYACNDLRKQGFKTEAIVNDSCIMFTITW